MNRLAHCVILLVLAALCCQCDRRQDTDGYGSMYPLSEENFGVIDSCMSYMDTNPAKAHQMLDSIQQANLVSPQRCDYLHAMVVFCGEGKSDSALQICNNLLDKCEFGDDQYLEEEICALASNITTSCNRHLETLKYANRGIALCHGHETMLSDEATMIGRVGLAHQMLGHLDQAIATYDKAYQLLDDTNSFGDFIALISIMKKQASVRSEMGEYDAAISVYHDILDMVERFNRDPSFVPQRPETMQSAGEATSCFTDFYACQMYGRIAHVYRLKAECGTPSEAESYRDSVKLYLDKWGKTDNASSPDNLSNVMHELLFIGNKSAFDEAKDVVASQYVSDSIVNDYVDYLNLLAQEAADDGDLMSSNAYLQRALAISDSIRQHDLLRTLSEQMSLNMVQEEQLARKDAENQVSRQRLVIILLSVLLVVMCAAGLIIVFLMRKNKESEQIIEETKQDLTETKEEVKELVHQLEETKTEKTVSSSEALYERIERAMTHKRLYLNPDLDVKTLAEEMCSSRTLISVCINNVTGKPFRQWISEYRLSLFEEKLKRNLDIPIDDLMRKCGYKDQSTFRRQFKAAYGMTASEYRAKLKSEIEAEIDEILNEAVDEEPDN